MFPVVFGQRTRGIAAADCNQCNVGGLGKAELFELAARKYVTGEQRFHPIGIRHLLPTAQFKMPPQMRGGRSGGFA